MAYPDTDARAECGRCKRRIYRFPRDEKAALRSGVPIRNRCERSDEHPDRCSSYLRPPRIPFPAVRP